MKWEYYDDEEWNIIYAHSYEEAALKFAEMFNNEDYALMNGNTEKVVISDGNAEKVFSVSAYSSIEYNVREE